MTKKKGIIIAAAAAGIAVIAGIAVFLADYFATVDYWDLKVGDKTVAVFATEEEAKAVIEKMENHYVK